MHSIVAWTRRSSLKQKILAVVVLGQVLTAAVCAIALYALGSAGQLQHRREAISEAKRNLQHGDMVHDELRAEVYRGAHAAATGASLDERTAILATATRASIDFRHDIEANAELDLDPETSSAIADVRPLLERYVDTALAFLTRAAVEPGSSAASLAEVESLFEQAAEAQSTALETLLSVERAQSAEASSSRGRAMWFVGLGGGGTFVGLLALSLWLGHSIVRALRSLGQVAERVVAGDLKARAVVTTRDEIGALASSFNAMADGLTSVVDKLAYDAQRDGLGRQLAEALEMADDERAVAKIVQRAIVQAAPQTPAELMLADASTANLERFAESPSAGAPGCPVRSPFGCPAIRKGGAVVFPDSTALNACPHLRDRPTGPCSAVCVPVSFMGRSLGVLHASGPMVEEVSPELVTNLTTVATQTGARIGTVRAFQKTQLQAATDGLTGLINRRTFENELRRMLATGTPVAVAIADLDRFKTLNDTAGHDAGDRALRHFAKVLKQSTRGTDLVARYGGEEFVFAFAGLDREGGKALLDRIRSALAASLRGDVPHFTSSFGVTDNSYGNDVAELVALADDALYRAKQGGRDRVEVGPTTGFARIDGALPANPRRASAAPPSEPMDHPLRSLTPLRVSLRLASSDSVRPPTEESPQRPSTPAARADR
ncbi:MAG: diguanylate cyclase [Polyangiaceae bacterium]